MKNYLVFLGLYTSGLAEGSLMICAGLHHWSAWPGAAWLTLPMLVATAIYTFGTKD